MLRATFQGLVKGIRAEHETKLWKGGVLSWRDFEKQCPVQGVLFSYENESQYSAFTEAELALRSEDAAYFASKLSISEHFRIPLGLPDRTVFLDIETTGLSRYYDVITMVGWSYQGKYGAYIRGGDEKALLKVLHEAQVIITFNGSMFDLPFLRTEFPNIHIPPVHIDLRFLSKRVGLTGGQKLIEEVLRVKRPPDVIGVVGESAPILWHQYRRGDIDAMKLLLRYNQADIEGMKRIFDVVAERLLIERETPARIRKSNPKFYTKSQGISRLLSSAKKDAPIRISPYKGHIGPKIHFNELTTTHFGEPLRVVGIDLTGSAARPSGWCLLNGAAATTKTLGSDEELVAATLASKPHLVSIDCPLSLPKGRTSVSDDDPGRAQFGIMRYSERVLKKRGVNVYPALIPSMQKMTARGIRLAATFRAMGLPVIESYPGAAQDIMGIPRKRASLQMLCDGLLEFGVHGGFQKEKVTHDELDAITSAIVGVFFWSGQFEALGEEDDEALIIPNLKTQLPDWHSRKVFGISGAIAAGKTTTAEILQSLGFSYTRYSLVIKALAEQKKQFKSRSDLQRLGMEVHKKMGQRWLGRKLLESLPTSGNVVIDGLRFPDDHAFLVETFGPSFHHLHVTAPYDLRKIRFSQREGEKKNELDDAERQPVELQVEKLAQLATTRLANTGTLLDLRSKIMDLIDA